MVDARTGELGQVGIAFSFGLVIMAMIYAVGHISGAHFDPVVTQSLRDHAPLSVAACRRLLVRPAGRRIGGRALPAGIPREHRAPRHHPAGGSDAQAFAWELLMTAILMFVVMAVATDTRAVGEAAAIAVGGTIGLCALFGGPITGASMNPARSAGPAIVSGELHALWIYLAAPSARCGGRRTALHRRAGGQPAPRAEVGRLGAEAVDRRLAVPAIAR